MKFFKKNNSIPNARLYFAEVVGENSEDETKALIVDKKGENPTQHYKTLHVYTDYWL